MRAGSATTYAGNTLLKTPEAHSLAIICFKKTKISLLIGRLTAELSCKYWVSEEGCRRAGPV
jgi:hypothetical protein